MSTILNQISSLVTAAVGWASTYVGMITSNDVLVLFCIAVPLVGLGIGIIKRLVRIRA